MEDSSLTMPMFIVFGLILLSAFFSGSETALTSVSPAKIHKLKMEGNKRAIQVNQLHQDMERLIGSILLGNNIVNIAASAIATALAIQILGQSGVIYATGVMTVLVLIFAEVLPKTYAVRHAEGVALKVAPLFIFLTKILAPFTITIQVIVSKVIDVISSGEKNEMTGVEVLRGAVDMYHQEGGVATEDKDMLSGIFNLGEIRVEEVMIHRSDMSSININLPVEEIVGYLVDSIHSRIPAWDGTPDHVIGMLYVKDIFKAVHHNKGEFHTLDIRSLVRNAWFIPEAITLKNQLQAFKERQEHIALVVDEFGSITGMLTLEDILEEVVGEIDDEHDEPTDSRITKHKNDNYTINGDITLRELNRELGWKLEHEEATTLAGYLLIEAQRIPDKGDIYDIGDYQFKVMEKEGNQITRIKLKQIACSLIEPVKTEPEKNADSEV